MNLVNQSFGIEIEFTYKQNSTSRTEGDTFVFNYYPEDKLKTTNEILNDFEKELKESTAFYTSFTDYDVSTDITTSYHYDTPKELKEGLLNILDKYNLLFTIKFTIK